MFMSYIDQVFVTEDKEQTHWVNKKESKLGCQVGKIRKASVCRKIDSVWSVCYT